MNEIDRQILYVHKIAWKYHRKSIPHEDLFQAGMLGLMKARKVLEYNNLNEFLAAAGVWIRGEILMTLRFEDRHKLYNNNELIDQAGSDGLNVEEWDAETFRTQWSSHLNKLDGRQRELIEYEFFNTKFEGSIKDLSNIFGITLECAKTRRKRGLTKLRSFINGEV